MKGVTNYSEEPQILAYMKYSDSEYNLQLLRVLNCRSILHSVKTQVQLHFSCTVFNPKIHQQLIF